MYWGRVLCFAKYNISQDVVIATSLEWTFKKGIRHIHERQDYHWLTKPNGTSIS